MTGAFTSQPFGGQVQIHPTGFNPSVPFQPTQLLPSPQTNSFAIQSQSAPQHRPFSTFIPQQATGLPSGATTGFLQPQPTGANPFRQSMLVSQVTGMPALNGIGIPPMPPLSAPQINPLSQMTSNMQMYASGQPLAQHAQVRQPLPSSTQSGRNNPSSEAPARPASTPLASTAASQSSTFPPVAQPVKSHQTGSRNPFGVPVTPAPPVPKPPTLLELSMGFGRLGTDGTQPLLQPQSTATTNSLAQNTTTSTRETTFSTVASSFAFTSKFEGNASPTSDLNRFSSHQLDLQTVSKTASSTASDFLSSQPTNAAASLNAPMIPMTGPIKSQPTGYGGVKPFKPTSSFGASLLESLPPIPQSGATTPDANAQTAAHSSTPSLPTSLAFNTFAASSVGKDNMVGTINSQPTGVSSPSQRLNGGFTPGIGLRPQATGSVGAANPFRATMFAATSAPSTVGGVPHTFASSASAPLFGGLSNGTVAFNPAFTFLGQDSSNMQQQNAGASLI